MSYPCEASVLLTSPALLQGVDRNGQRCVSEDLVDHQRHSVPSEAVDATPYARNGETLNLVVKAMCLHGQERQVEGPVRRLLVGLDLRDEVVHEATTALQDCYIPHSFSLGTKLRYAAKPALERHSNASRHRQVLAYAVSQGILRWAGECLPDGIAAGRLGLVPLPS